MTKDIAIVPSEVVSAVLENAGEDLILVGGESLALWFREKRLPQLASLMSATRRKELSLPA